MVVSPFNLGGEAKIWVVDKSAYFIEAGKQKKKRG
jgi:hypothetical protein